MLFRKGSSLRIWISILVGALLYPIGQFLQTVFLQTGTFTFVIGSVFFISAFILHYLAALFFSLLYYIARKWSLDLRKKTLLLLLPYVADLAFAWYLAGLFYRTPGMGKDFSWFWLVTLGARWMMYMTIGREISRKYEIT